MTTPAVSLPSSEHAYALPVSLTLMVPSDLDAAGWADLEEACDQRTLEQPPELEVPDDEETEENPTIKPTPNEPEEKTSTRSLIALEGDLTDGTAPFENPPARVAEPMDLPRAGLAPGVLTVTRGEIQWMGKTVTILTDGEVSGAEPDDLLIEAVARAVKETDAATKRAASRCGLPMAPPIPLVVMDARVPVETFNRAIYSLAQGGFTSYAMAVADPAPEVSRLHNPVGGRSGAGSLEVNASSYGWRMRREARDGHEPWKRIERAEVTWPRGAPLPKNLGETSAPSATVSVDPREPYSMLVETWDRLAGMKIFCLVPSVMRDESPAPAPAPPPAPTPSSLRLDPTGTIAAHLLEPSSHWSGFIRSRADGTRCLMEPLLLRGQGPDKAQTPSAPGPAPGGD
ncbi:MAG: hypothetical protein VYE15_05070 [Myxococcota bacterium]|nr:hypothetical protein [Myxococcota bacterium]